MTRPPALNKQPAAPKRVVPHAIHPFPARMAASIPWRVLAKPRRLRVLDPMAGSGTTLVVARALGHDALGFDTDPLAVLIARAWCSVTDEDGLRQAAERILESARKEYRSLTVGAAYPAHADDETRAFIRYWFDETNRRQLTSLAHAIMRVRDTIVRRLLWCSFSRLIITKQASASRALDLAHSRPHRVDREPIRPFEHFTTAVEGVLRGCTFREGDDKRPPATVRRGDARRLPLEDGSVDMVVTSPPYVNAIDYLRAHKFSLVWMGHSIGALRSVRASNIGTEVGSAAPDSVHVLRALGKMGKVDELPTREQGMLRRFTHDMDRTLKEVSRVLVRAGRAVLVVGDSTMRGVYVSNSRAIIDLAAQHGLVLESSRRRPLPANRRYLPPPSSTASGAQLRSRMRTEAILTLCKT